MKLERTPSKLRERERDGVKASADLKQNVRDLKIPALAVRKAIDGIER